MRAFEFVGRVNVIPLVLSLEAHPELWNEHSGRTDKKGPHAQVNDIWVRYNKIENFGARFNDEHTSVWYPCIHKIPFAATVARRVVEMVGGGKLGGVLITQLPPGGRVTKHIDSGWHAKHYEKFFVNLSGNAEFCFDSGTIHARDGDVYHFRNDVPHWVNNPSNRQSVRMIICIKPDNPELQWMCQ